MALIHLEVENLAMEKTLDFSLNNFLQPLVYTARSKLLTIARMVRSPLICHMFSSLLFSFLHSASLPLPLDLSLTPSFPPLSSLPLPLQSPRPHNLLHFSSLSDCAFAFSNLLYFGWLIFSCYGLYSSGFGGFNSNAPHLMQ